MAKGGIKLKREPLKERASTEPTCLRPDPTAVEKISRTLSEQNPRWSTRRCNDRAVIEWYKAGQTRSET